MSLVAPFCDTVYNEMLAYQQIQMVSLREIEDQLTTLTSGVSSMHGCQLVT